MLPLLLLALAATCAVAFSPGPIQYGSVYMNGNTPKVRDVAM